MRLAHSALIAARAGFTAMRANPVRALLATLGVVIGSAALVSVLAVSDGVESYARERVSRQSFDRVTIRPITDDLIDGQRMPRADTAMLTIENMMTFVPGLLAGERATLASQGVARAELGVPRRVRALSVRGVALTAPERRALLAGRDLTPEESRDGIAVAVIGEALARVMLDDAADASAPLDAARAALLIGDSLAVGTGWIRVVGVAARDEEAGPGAELGLTAPLAVARGVSVTPRGGSMPALIVRTERAEELPAMRARVEAWLASRDPGWTERLRISARPESQIAEVRRGFLIFRLLMGSITGITLIVGGIGIMNVLLASVAERTREIGVRRAVGARRRDILLQFLAESVTITMSGAAIGTALGLAAAYGVAALMRSQTQAVIHAATTPGTLLLSAFVAVLVGFVFGCYPASLAARLAPIDAIHTE